MAVFVRADFLAYKAELFEDKGVVLDVFRLVEDLGGDVLFLGELLLFHLTEFTDLLYLIVTLPTSNIYD